MRVQVRKCRLTGEIFEEGDLERYAVHLRELRAHRHKERVRQANIQSLHKWLWAEKQHILTVDQIPEWIIANQRKLMRFSNGILPEHNRFYTSDQILSLTFTRHRLDSHSHSYVQHGPLVPSDDTRRYIGYFKSSLKRSKQNDWRYPLNEMLNMIGLFTASGGGGNISAGYSFYIYLSDWSGIADQLLANRMSGVDMRITA